MSKRKRTYDLNQKNWDEEEEPESAGQFCEASNEEFKKPLAKKVWFKQAKESTFNILSTPMEGTFSGFSGWATGSESLPSLATGSTSTTAPAPGIGTGDIGNGENVAYFSRIMKLNMSFRDWISKHVNEQPLCNLSPCFRDYKMHFQEIRYKRDQERKGTTFSFPSSEPSAATIPNEKGGEEDDDGDVKGSGEINETIEEDALYTKDCKVFFRESKGFIGHGKGTCYLKPIKGSEKVQLLVRSGSNLETIFINVELDKGMVNQGVVRNCVMLCYINPADGKPRTALLRVKDDAETNELLAMITKHQT